jgi:hypothetical protein
MDTEKTSVWLRRLECMNIKKTIYAMHEIQSKGAQILTFLLTLL